MGNLYIGGSAGGGGTYTIQELSADGTVTGFDYMVLVDASANNVKVTLPTTNTTTTKGHSISVKRLDNTNNTVSIVPSVNTEMIEGVVNGTIYLYNRGDSVVITSIGTGDCKITADNRSGLGSSANYLYATRTTQQTSVGVGTVIQFTKTTSQIGIGIQIDNSTGIVTMSPNIEYSVKASLQSAPSTNGSIVADLQSSTDGITWTTVSCCANIASGNAWADTDPSPIASTTIKSAIKTYLRLKVTTIAGTSTVGNGGATTNNYPWIEIEEKSRQATVINSCDYITAYQSATQNVASSNTILNINTKLEGNMTLNADYTISLKAGKTYYLTGSGGYCSGVVMDVCFKDVTKNVEISPYEGYNISQGATISAHYTPSSDCKVALFVKYVNPTGTIGLVQSSPARMLNAWFTITQVGTTATTSVPMSLISEIQDKANSGYLDIGTTRIQWGKNLGSGVEIYTATFPVPFASSSYAITTSMANGGDWVYCVGAYGKTTTGFTARKRLVNASGGLGVATAESFDYIAIGLKP